MKIFKEMILAGVLTLGLNQVVLAAPVTYDYVGSMFTKFVDSTGGTGYAGLTNITGFVTFNAPIDSSGVVTVAYEEANDVVITQNSNNSQNVFGGAAGFSFYDGLNSLNSTNIDSASLGFVFNNGNIVNWNILLTKEGLVDGEVSGDFYQSIAVGGDRAGFEGESSEEMRVARDDVIEVYAANTLSGTWTLREVSAVPEPETYMMLMVGLSLIGFVSRRRLNS